MNQVLSKYINPDEFIKKLKNKINNIVKRNDELNEYLKKAYDENSDLKMINARLSNEVLVLKNKYKEPHFIFGGDEHVSCLFEYPFRTFNLNDKFLISGYVSKTTTSINKDNKKELIISIKLEKAFKNEN